MAYGSASDIAPSGRRAEGELMGAAPDRPPPSPAALGSWRADPSRTPASSSALPSTLQPRQHSANPPAPVLATAMTVGASPSSVRTTPSRNDQRLLQSGATIPSRRDLPPFKSVLTSLGELAVLVNENLRTRFAAVLLERD